MKSEKLRFLDKDNLEAFAPVLSEESYQGLREELERLKENAPPASGSGVNHLAYVPGNLEECKEKIKRLQERLQWVGQVCFLYEICERQTRRRNEQLEKKNKELTEENNTLREDVKRAYNQIQEILGVKNTKNHKEKNKNKEDKEKEPSRKGRGAPKGHTGRTRPVPVEIDKIDIIPPPERCPCCNSSDVLPGDGYISKYIEDIVPIVKMTTEKRYIKGTCTHCHEQVVSSEATSGPPVIVGHNLIALLSIMREQMGASYRKLSTFSSEVLQVPLTPSGALGIINRVSEKVKPVYKGIEVSLSAQSVLHGDETGWRMDGQRWYMWVFCNRDIVYFHPDESRASKVPRGIVGEDYNGVMHADFYGAYNIFKNLQRCLVHFLRKLKEELEVTPGEKSLLKLKKGMKNIIQKGEEVKVLPAPRKKLEIEKLERKLQALMEIKSTNKGATLLVNRIKKHKDELLQFVKYEDAEYHNNRAERTIRKVVIFRKLSFGSRTPEGAQYHAILTSVLETCRLKGKSILVFLKDILKTPDDQLHEITELLLAPP
ncbi:MAG: IS66 family transposase [Candidatus Brocadiaceae bacterium]|nr:IS66 family transposase [Candidatus Brocadiaceae bacterium]